MSELQAAGSAPHGSPYPPFALSPTAPFPLPPLPHLRLRIALRALATAQVPEFTGSMLRGAFGHALRRSVCTMGRDQACAECRLRHDCSYARIFESPIEADGPGGVPPFLRGLPSAPHPYVFEPHPSPRNLSSGGRLTFDLLLFGRAIGHQARVLLAIERMGEGGLGAGRVRFALDRVEVVREDERREEPVWGPRRPNPPRALFDGAWKSTALEPGRPLPSAPLPVSASETGRLRLRFETPIRLHRKGQIVSPDDLRLLAFVMVRRHLELAHFEAAGEAERAAIDWRFRPLLDAASALRVVGRQLSFKNLTRYSHRQDRPVEIGGYVGTLRLEGDFAPLLPLFRAAEVLHVGKGAVFGLGRVVVEAVSR